jgi:hypothetical protein
MRPPHSLSGQARYLGDISLAIAGIAMQLRDSIRARARASSFLVLFMFVSSSYNKFQVNKFSISRLRDTRDTIAVGQQGEVLFPPVEPKGCYSDSQFP